MFSHVKMKRTQNFILSAREQFPDQRFVRDVVYDNELSKCMNKTMFSICQYIMRHFTKCLWLSMSLLHACGLFSLYNYFFNMVWGTFSSLNSQQVGKEFDQERIKKKKEFDQDEEHGVTFWNSDQHQSLPGFPCTRDSQSSSLIKFSSHFVWQWIFTSSQLK